MRYLIAMFVLMSFYILSLPVHAEDNGFGGVPTLGPRDSLRQLLKPYDLVKLNVLGANYCENLLDMRLNVTSYTHLNFDTPTGDAWNLQFPDDSARFLEALVWEEEYAPVARLETVRRLVKGLLAARVPGTYSDSFFRHRSGGKTFLLFGDRQGKEGRWLLSMWGDEISGAVKVGFRMQRAGTWLDISRFRHADPPDSPAEAGRARSARYWNESPVVLHRTYNADDTAVEFTGRYGFSDEDKPLECSFTAKEADRMQVVIGEPGAPIPLLGDYRIPTTIHLPDRKTTFRSDTDGDRAFENPAFRYLVLRKPGAWGATGYSTALLVAWEGLPEKVEVIADKGYGEVRVTWAGPSGRVWLNPYHWLDDRDLEAVFRSAEQFLEKGTLLQNCFPTQQMLNAIPAGLAAGAYLLTRYGDPMAPTARINAARAVDRLFAVEDEGKKLARVFFTVKAAAWMVRTAQELGDAPSAKRYTALVDRAMKRMCSPETGYDGRGWAGGWDHFNSAKACRLAYDATGNAEYLRAYERALSVYTIDAQGIYRDGKKLDAPGGFDTYSGSLPLAVWGNAGMLDRVNQLINLDAPNGWHEPQRPVKDTWNDAGAGPWAQDDANPEYVGFSLRGARLPLEKKHLLPTGAFPLYDTTGTVKATGKPLVRNPFFLPGQMRSRAVSSKDIRRGPKVATVEIVPGSESERRHGVVLSGRVDAGRRTCFGTDAPLVYRFDTAGATGLGLDMRVRGNGYRVEVSPDGKRWYERLDTWDREAADQSLDLSFLAGSREELLRLETIVPPDDAPRLVAATGSVLEREHCRYAARGSSLVYRLDLPDVTEGWLEMMVGNGYRIETSSDRKTWRTAASSSDLDGGNGKAGTDAAVIRMVDVTSHLRGGRRVFVRLADLGDAAAFDGRTAFLRRMTVYGVFRSGQAWVRLSNVSSQGDRSFTVERLTLRKWAR